VARFLFEMEHSDPVRAEEAGAKITRARLTSSTAAPWIAGQWGQGGITGCRDDSRRHELFLLCAKKSEDTVK
jgi:hypothetical protein